VTIQAQILNLLREIQKKNHSSIIMITHDLGVVAGMADRIAVMYAGEIVEEGSVREIFKNPQHPYTYAMLNAVPNPELESKAELHVIKGTPPDLISPPKGCPFASRCKFCMQVCHEYEPEKTEISEGHFSKCWLHHQTAKKLYKFDNVRSVMAE
jgi:oligopeptide transport system ATP-binding protein